MRPARVHIYAVKDLSGLLSVRSRRVGEDNGAGARQVLDDEAPYRVPPLLALGGEEEGAEGFCVTGFGCGKTGETVPSVINGFGFKLARQSFQSFSIHRASPSTVCSRLELRERRSLRLSPYL